MDYKVNTGGVAAEKSFSQRSEIDIRIMIIPVDLISIRCAFYNTKV